MEYTMRKLSRFIIDLLAITLIIFLFSGCKDTSDENLLIQPQNWYSYSIGTTCEGDPFVILLTDYESYLESDIHPEYEEDFFDDKLLVRISNIPGDVNAEYSVKKIVRYESDLYVLYEQGDQARISPCCYEIIIEMEKSIYFEDLYQCKSQEVDFSGPSGKVISIFPLLDDDCFVILETNDSFFVSKGSYLDDGINTLIGNVVFEGFSEESNEITIEVDDDQQLKLFFGGETYTLITDESE